MNANGTTYLKVKIKSLAAEARIIRLEERRATSTSLKCGLAEHRRGVVRREARLSQLAYGFLRGRALAAIESKRRPGNAPDWKRVASLVARYASNASQAATLDEWRA
jgi:uncharacterized coiled-coil protein SlyX